MTKHQTLPPITAEKGKIFQIHKQDNPSTGFSCALESIPECVVLLSDEYLPPQTHLVSAPGTRRFTFLPVKPGEGPINFVYIRPFDYENPLPKEPSDKQFVMVK